jgi:hypothetical protein
VTSPDGRTFSNDNASGLTKDSVLLLPIDTSGSWKVQLTHSATNRVGGPAYSYNLLTRLVSVPGAAVSFPGTLEGASPQSTCFDIPDSRGVFVDAAPAVCNLDVAGLPASASNVNLLLHLVHTFPSDIRLTLSHPDGTTVTLVNHTGRLDGVFDVDFPVDDTTLTLDAFNGKNPNGRWVLRAYDWYSFDVGQIHAATLFVAP